MTVSVRSEWYPKLEVRVYTAHVRCGSCDAEVTAAAGGESGAQSAADIACGRAADLGWTITESAARCPAHQEGP